MWRFVPIYKRTIWGGSRIFPFKGLATACDSVGESWELSGEPGYVSVVDGGGDDGMSLTELIDKYGSSLLGERNFRKYGNRFPLLVKFIDAESDLSVQVHPDNRLAEELGMINGKTEMWYVLEAKDDARLANGFSKNVDPDEFAGMVRSGRVLDVLHYCPVKPGDTFLNPAGRIHAIGAGCLVLEIQQTSDATFRIYDYDRHDHEGKPRELHTDLALRALNFEDGPGEPVSYTPQYDIPVNIVRTPYFVANLLNLSREMMRDYSERDSFVIIVAVEGRATLRAKERSVQIERGSTVLVPASVNALEIDPEGDFTAVEVYIG